MRSGEGSGPKHRGVERPLPHGRVVEFLEKLAGNLEDDQRKVAAVRGGERAVSVLRRLAQECRAAKTRLQAGDVSPARDLLQRELRKFRAQASRGDVSAGKRPEDASIIAQYEQILAELGQLEKPGSTTGRGIGFE